MPKIGYRHTAEARRKMSLSTTGEVRSPETRAKVAAARTTHGMSGTPIWRIWASMRERCQSPRALAYMNYGGRGITVCDRWQIFENFFADMGHRPEGRSLDRVDNDQGYSPENCRWATRSEQAQNRRLPRRKN